MKEERAPSISSRAIAALFYISKSSSTLFSRSIRLLPPPINTEIRWSFGRDSETRIINAKHLFMDKICFHQLAMGCGECLFFSTLRFRLSCLYMYVCTYIRNQKSSMGRILEEEVLIYLTRSAERCFSLPARKGNTCIRSRDFDQMLTPS